MNSSGGTGKLQQGWKPAEDDIPLHVNADPLGSGAPHAARHQRRRTLGLTHRVKQRIVHRHLLAPIFQSLAFGRQVQLPTLG